MWCVLTKSGSLHYFDSKTDAEPSFSLPLFNVTVSMGPREDVGENVIMLSQPNTGFFTLQKVNVYVKERDTERRASAWLDVHACVFPFCFARIQDVSASRIRRHHGRLDRRVETPR